MKLDAIILKILSEKDLYGYQISTELKQLSDDFFSIKTGTLYPLLRTMVSNGLLDTYELEIQEQKRTFYTVTNSGLKYLETAIREWELYSEKIKNIFGI